MMKIGILGGSFDPVHNGHITIVKKAISDLNLDKFLIIPTKNNPWKDSSKASDQDRLNMLEIAFKDEDKVFISDIELNSDTEDKNYTIDTLKQLKIIYPNDELYYIMGMDQASKFHLWYQCDEIVKLCRLVTFDRVGYLKNDNLEMYHFIKLDIEAMSDSSTSIREGHIDYLPDEVLRYLTNNGIYLDTIIKPLMSKPRYLHTLSMANLAMEIAKCNGLDSKKIYIAGMFHDVAKELDRDLETKLMRKFYPQYLDKPRQVYHQWLSAYLAKNVYLIDDEDILRAITNHTTGSVDMTLFDMCIYVADKYDPRRDFDSSKEIALCKNDLREGFKQSLIDFLEFSNAKGRSIDDCFFDVYNKFVKGEIDE